MKFKLVALFIAVTFTLSAFASGNKAKEKAPTFSYPSLDKEKSLGPADFEGRYLLIDFWASWCPPCNAAIPTLKNLYSQYSSKGLDILGVSIDGNEQAWRKKVEEKELKWKNIMTSDKGKQVSSLYGFNAIPYFVLLDKSGNIVSKGFSIDELAEILKTTIK